MKVIVTLEDDRTFEEDNIDAPNQRDAITIATRILENRGVVGVGRAELFDGGNTPLTKRGVILLGYAEPMSLSELADVVSIDHNTLYKAAYDGRLVAKKSGGTYISSRMAVECAIEQGKIRK